MASSRVDFVLREVRFLALVGSDAAMSEVGRRICAWLPWETELMTSDRGETRRDRKRPA